MTIPTIPFGQLLEMMKQLKSSGAVFVADKDKPPSIKMFEEARYEEARRRREELDRHTREEEERADEDYWDEVFFGL